MYIRTYVSIYYTYIYNLHTCTAQQKPFVHCSWLYNVTSMDRCYYVLLFHLCKKYKHDSLRSARQRSQNLQIIHLPIRWSLPSRPLAIGMQNMWWCDYTSLAVYWFHFHLLHFTHAKLPLKTYATKQRHHLGAHLMSNKETLFNLVVTSGRLGDGFGKTSDLHNEHNKLLQICGLTRERVFSKRQCLGASERFNKNAFEWWIIFTQKQHICLHFIRSSLV